MSSAKKAIRQAFRDAVFSRDLFRCVACVGIAVDAHHIISRDIAPNGGYVEENGVSLCEGCHIRAEAGEWSAEQLRAMIGGRKA